MSKRRYWAVMWGGWNRDGEPDGEPVTRLAGPCESGIRAKQEAFGMVSDNMTAIEMLGNPRYMSHKNKKARLDRLMQMHKYKCEGWKRERQEKADEARNQEECMAPSVDHEDLPTNAAFESTPMSDHFPTCEYDWI